MDKLEESALARSFEELFGIEYHSEQRSYVETQLWEPIKAWLGAADTEGLILEKLEDRLEIDASLPDLSMIPFDRLTHFRNDFLSSTIGGSEGRLHNVKVAEAMARLVTGKMVRAGLVYPMVAAPEPSEAGEGEPASGEDDGSVAPPASADEGGAAIEQWADCPLAESSRERIAKGMARVFKSGGTGRPQEHRALLRELGEHNVAILGKTGTHLDAREGRPTIVDSLMIAAVGRPVDEDEGSRLTEGFVIVIYVGDTVQHQATEVLYALVPAVSSHHRYHHWELEF
ncbi:MAG: hypothetical protein GY856_15615 [bacterium]|nr:hypothetical protein [bacterium]